MNLSRKQDVDPKGELKSSSVEGSTTPQLTQILHGYVEDKHAEEFTSLILHHVASNPVKILLCTWNHPWGIGDYVHNLDFAVHYEELVKSIPNIQINSLCFVPEEKIGLALELKKGKFDETASEVFNSKNTEFKPEIIEQHRHLIWTNDDKQGVTLDDKPGQALSSYMSESAGQYSSIINISRTFAEDAVLTNFYYSALQSNVYMQSINEYGRWSNTSSFLYDSVAMGVASQAGQVGIKFSENILELATKEKREVAQSIQDEKLKQIIIDTMEKKHSLGMAYLQDNESFGQFILTVAAATEVDCDVLVNNISLTEIDKHTKILKNLGFGIVECEGKTITIGEGEKTMRIKKFSNISQSDKEKMLAVSDFVGGSGDTSYSELLSSGKFPFFQSRPWKHCFFAGLLADIDKIPEQDLSILKQYIMLNLFSNINNRSYSQIQKECGMELKFSEMPGGDYQELAKFVQEHRKTILEQFQWYANYVYKNHNVKSAQNDVLVRSLIASVLNKGDKNEISLLLKVLPDWRMNNTNFVLFAILQKNTSLLQQLNANDPMRFAQLLMEKHLLAKTQPTGIEHLLKQNNIESLSLIDAKAGVASKLITHSFLNKVLSEASLEACELLFNKFEQGNGIKGKEALLNYLQSKDDKGNIPLHYAVKSGDLAKVKFILEKAGPDIQMMSVINENNETPQSIAKEMKNNDIIKLLCPDAELEMTSREQPSTTLFLLDQLSTGHRLLAIDSYDTESDDNQSFEMEIVETYDTSNDNMDSQQPLLEIATNEIESTSPLASPTNSSQSASPSKSEESSDHQVNSSRFKNK